MVKPTVNLLKAVYEVDIWKVELDGSVSLKNADGHSDRLIKGELKKL